MSGGAPPDGVAGHSISDSDNDNNNNSSSSSKRGRDRAESSRDRHGGSSARRRIKAEPVSDSEDNDGNDDAPDKEKTGSNARGQKAVASRAKKKCKADGVEKKAGPRKSTGGGGERGGGKDEDPTLVCVVSNVFGFACCLLKRQTPRKVRNREERTWGKGLGLAASFAVLRTICPMREFCVQVSTSTKIGDFYLFCFGDNSDGVGSICRHNCCVRPFTYEIVVDGQHLPSKSCRPPRARVRGVTAHCCPPPADLTNSLHQRAVLR